MDFFIKFDYLYVKKHKGIGYGSIFKTICHH